jgi:hypothetical protein
MNRAISVGSAADLSVEGFQIGMAEGIGADAPGSGQLSSDPV